jgi:hypothetical protein
MADDTGSYEVTKAISQWRYTGGIVEQDGDNITFRTAEGGSIWSASSYHLDEGGPACIPLLAYAYALDKLVMHNKKQL